MSKNVSELKDIMAKFAESGWDLISIPTGEWLEGKGDKDTLILAIKEDQKECGSCGCEFDALYKRAVELKDLF